MTTTAPQGESPEEIVKKFHQYWLDNGEPHPNSNAYLALNRRFFFQKGWEAHERLTQRLSQALKPPQRKGER